MVAGERLRAYPLPSDALPYLCLTEAHDSVLRLPTHPAQPNPTSGCMQAQHTCHAHHRGMMI